MQIILCASGFVPVNPSLCLKAVHALPWFISLHHFRFSMFHDFHHCSSCGMFPVNSYHIHHVLSCSIIVFPRFPRYSAFSNQSSIVFMTSRCQSCFMIFWSIFIFVIISHHSSLFSSFSFVPSYSIIFHHLSSPFISECLNLKSM